MESFLYAIDQINTNKTLLPGVRLGYDARDTCRDAQVAIQQTLDFISDTEYYNYGRDSVVVVGNNNNTTNGTMDGVMKNNDDDNTCKCVGETNSKLIGGVGKYE